MSHLHSFHHVSKLHQSIRCSRQQSSVWPQIHVDPIKGSIVWDDRIETADGRCSGSMAAKVLSFLWVSEWGVRQLEGLLVGLLSGGTFHQSNSPGGVERGVVPPISAKAPSLYDSPVDSACRRESLHPKAFHQYFIFRGNPVTYMYCISRCLAKCFLGKAFGWTFLTTPN